MNESHSGKADSLEQLLSNLRQHEWSINWKTADALAEMGQDAFPHLLRALEDPDGFMIEELIAQLSNSWIAHAIVTWQSWPWENCVTRELVTY